MSKRAPGVPPHANPGTPGAGQRARDIEALVEAIEQRLDRPHAWGLTGNDPLAFVAAAVRAQTGRKPFGRTRWTSRPGLMRLLERARGPDRPADCAMQAMLDRHFARVSPAMAMRGDIAGVADDDYGIAPMIVEGPTLVGPGPAGQRRLPRRAMLIAWSIG